MDTLPFVAVMISALLHASWNAMAQSAPEPGDALACSVAVSGLVGLAGLSWFGLPAMISLPWLVGGVLINTIGIRLAMAAYRSASFGLAYPVMRAGIPLLTLPVGAVLLSEWPGLSGVVGVLLIASALIMLAMAARRAGSGETRGLWFALAAAVAGAGYVTADAVGVRLSGNVFGYAFLVSTGNAIAIILLSALEGKNLLRILPANARRSVRIAALSNTSFLLYIWAVSITPVALAAALRETSVLFAMGLARFVLKERIGRYQWAAAALAFAGVISIRMA